MSPVALPATEPPSPDPPSTPSNDPGPISEQAVETGAIVLSIVFGMCCCSCFCWYRWNRKRRYAMWADEEVDDYVEL